ncbi:exportin-5-like isoform X2 [Ambystoma mexicanum]|uniref:exportin-5-like isoform X2 n=1 Tax=Ambystoma mexicanum TaxID=8296 RepID=UPI0037E730E2
MSAEEINKTVEFLKSKLWIVNSAYQPQKDKAEAQKVLDNFKGKGQHAVDCALRLVKTTDTSFSLYGLQILKHAAKTQWESMSPTDQSFMKKKIKYLIANGQKGLMLEKTNLKDGFARVAVEMIKQDWPHRWPNLLEELGIISINEVLDDFKEKGLDASDCALTLAKNTDSPFTLYGLQILQHVVKKQWQCMSPVDQDSMKRKIMCLIADRGPKTVVLEKSNNKEGFARVVVEMIKQDWPERWPNLLMELENMSRNEGVSGELVLYILWRLADDVANLKDNPVPRAPVINHLLLQNMESILRIILGVLNKNVACFRTLKRTQLFPEQSQASCSVAATAVYAFSGYMGWMSMWWITQGNYSLLVKLWSLLDVPELQRPVAECLLLAIQRMENNKDDNLIPIFFGESVMDYILFASKITTGDKLSEERRNALTKLCQIVCALGKALCNTMVSQTPITFERYLSSLLELTEGFQEFQNFCTLSTWSAILKHNILSHDRHLQAILPEFLSAMVTNMEKVGFHSKDSSDQSACDGLSTDKDFRTIFKTINEEEREIIKVICKMGPVIYFQMACLCLKYQLSPALKTSRATELKFYNSALSTSLEQWQAKAFFIEIVMGEVFEPLSKEAVPVKEIMEPILLAAKFEPTDPAILQCVDIALSSLLPFFHALNECSVEFLTQMLEVIKSVKVPELQSLNNVKNCAFAYIIKMCRENTQLFLPHFETFFNYVKALLSNELLLTTMEKDCLTNLLIHLSNHFLNYERQRAFLEELLAPVNTLWLSDVMQSLLTDPETFIAYVGADLAITNPESPTALYRSRISYCVSIIHQVLGSTQRPSKIHEALEGGFIAGCMPTGPIYRNPTTEMVLPLLQNVLILIRTMHILHLPEVRSFVGSKFDLVLKRPAVPNIPCPDPKMPLLQMFYQPVYETDVERIQEFLYTLYVQCFSILGYAARALKEQFYKLDHLVFQLLNSALINLEHIPTYKLNTMLTQFVKPFTVSCPPQQYSTFLCPVIAPFLATIHERLSKEWQIITQLKNGKQDESPTSQQDVELDQVRLLTQKIIKFIDSSCVATKAGNTIFQAAKNAGEVNDIHAEHTPSLGLTELGKCLMKETDIRASLLITAFSSLAWNESLTYYKTATRVCLQLLNHVVSEPLLPDAVAYFFSMVLKGLKQNTDHKEYIDCLVQLGFQIYESLRPRYAKLKEVLQQLPGIVDVFLLSYDQRVISTPLSPEDYVMRKYCFASLLQGYVGKKLTGAHVEEGSNSNHPVPVEPTPTKPPTSYEAPFVRYPLGTPDMFGTPMVKMLIPPPDWYPTHPPPNFLENSFQNPENVAFPPATPHMFETPVIQMHIPPPTWNQMNTPVLNLYNSPFVRPGHYPFNPTVPPPPIWNPTPQIPHLN